MVLPTCTRVATSALVCDPYDFGDDSSRAFLRGSPDIDCDGEFYKRRILPAAIIGVLVYPVAILVACAVVLASYRSVLTSKLPVEEPLYAALGGEPNAAPVLPTEDNRNRAPPHKALPERSGS